MSLHQILLFDLGGVLVENASFERLNALMPRPLDMAELKQRWLASPALRAFERGRLAPEEFAARFVAEWHLACGAHTLLEEFTAWPRGFYPGVDALLARLRPHFRLGCLSNSNALHWARFGGFAGCFDITLSSHLLGVIKPDAECFTHAVAACGVPAGAVAFFDDSIANVEAARAIGMRAFHVHGTVELIAVLRQEGLFPEAPE